MESQPSSSPSEPPATPPRHPAASWQSPRLKLQHPTPGSARGKHHSKARAKTPPKAKRKKTLPEDKVILDAAYELNPTPDKATRRELVRRCIDMSEARVQIWFQNRRQIDRRKSSPYSPQVVEDFTQGRMRIISPDTVCLKNAPLNLETLAVAAATGMAPPEHGPDSPAPSDAASRHPSADSGDVRESLQQSNAPIIWEGLGTASSQETAASAPFERPSEPRPVLSRSFSAATGYLSNRRNAAGSSSQPPTLGADDSFRSEPPSSSCPPAVPSGAGSEAFSPRPRSRSSRFRLSMSLDGRAEITQSTTSPPRPSLSPGEQFSFGPLGLNDSVLLPPLQFPGGPAASQNPRRSLPLPSPVNSMPRPHHAAPPSRDPRGTLNYLCNSVSRPPSLRRGRSSDVQAWEDCATADSEFREDPLIRQAKHESSGSAIAAINLVRSTSATSSLEQMASSSAKRRAPMGKAGAHAGVAKRTKFSRPSGGGGRTAFAPSQRHTNAQPRAAIADEYVTAAQKATTTIIGKTFASWEGNNNNNDSDKENWSPDEDGNPRRSFRTTNSNTLSSSGRHPLPSSAASKLDGGHRNPRRTTAALQEPSRRMMASLQRGNSSPAGSWSSYAARRRQGGGVKPSLQGRSQSALEIYEDGDDEDKENDDAACERLLEMCGVGGVSPSKEKAVAAATGLLSLKWGR